MRSYYLPLEPSPSAKFQYLPQGFLFSSMHVQHIHCMIVYVCDIQWSCFIYGGSQHHRPLLSFVTN